MPAVALTDTDGLYAAVPFYQAAKKAGVKPNRRRGAGCRNGHKIEERFLASPGMTEISKRHISFAGADMEGYSNLCQLVTLRIWARPSWHKMRCCGNRWPPVTLQELAEHSRGVIALCPLPARSRDVGAVGAQHAAPLQRQFSKMPIVSLPQVTKSRITSHFRN